MDIIYKDNENAMLKDDFAFSYHSYNFKTSFKLQKRIMLVTLTQSINMISHILYINKIAKTLNNYYERLRN